MESQPPLLPPAPAAPLSSKKSGFLKTFLIVIALILFGILIGVLASRFVPMTESSTAIATPTPTVAITPVGLETPTPTIDETTGWKTFNDMNTGFEFKYPVSVGLNIDQKNSPVSVITTKITAINKIIDEPMGFSKATAIKDEASLAQGKYGEHLSMGLPLSEKVFQIGNVYGKTFTEIQTIDVCDVRFMRTAIVYHKGYQIVVSYNGPKSLIVDSPNYFTKDATNCGSLPRWIEGNTFYQDVVSNKAPQSAQLWYSTFDQILSTFKFTN